MSIYRHEGSDVWYVRIQIDGQRVRHSTGTTSKQQAQEYHDKLKAELWSRSKLDEKPQVTWDEAVKRYIQAKQHKRTIEHDKAMLRWSLPMLKGKKLSSINKATLSAIAEERRKGKSSRTVDGVSNATINRHMQAINGVLRYAFECGLIDSPPHWKKLKESEGRVRWLTIEEQHRLLAVLPDHLRAMAEFTLCTGLRENNVLELEWSQVDMERKVCWIHPDQSKTGKSISVTLNERALKVLSGQIGKHETIVFPYAGKRMYKASSAGWYRALKRAKIDNFTWHGLRHTWASWHVMNGTSLAALQKLGGWSSINIVQRYAHLSNDHVASFAENAPRF